MVTLVAEAEQGELTMSMQLDGMFFHPISNGLLVSEFKYGRVVRQDVIEQRDGESKAELYTRMMEFVADICGDTNYYDVVESGDHEQS